MHQKYPRAVISLTAVVGMAWAVSTAVAQDAPSAEERRDVSPLRRLMDESLAWYELFAEGSAKPMTTRVAMRWANNTRGSEGGMTVLYLTDGIPQAVCSIYPWERLLCHEFDSLSRSKFVGKSAGKEMWTPVKPGVEFQPIPDAETPSATPVVRLRQMKSLASTFSSTMLGWKSDRSDREDLRLLPQPLYRYEVSPTGNRFDGAVFAFVQGTDPESLLLIEAVQNNGGARWEFAFVRQTSGELEGRHRDAVVWHADRYPPSDLPQGIHFTIPVPLPVDVAESLKRKE